MQGTEQCGRREDLKGHKEAEQHHSIICSLEEASNLPQQHHISAGMRKAGGRYFFPYAETALHNQ